MGSAQTARSVIFWSCRHTGVHRSPCWLADIAALGAVIHTRSALTEFGVSFPRRGKAGFGECHDGYTIV